MAGYSEIWPLKATRSLQRVNILYIIHIIYYILYIGAIYISHIIIYNHTRKLKAYIKILNTTKQTWDVREGHFS